MNKFMNFTNYYHQMNIEYLYCEKLKDSPELSYAMVQVLLYFKIQSLAYKLVN